MDSAPRKPPIGSAQPILDMRLVDKVLLMQQGYVLDFDDAQLDDFVRRRFGVDLRAPTYVVDGTSKAKRLRAFLRALVPGAQAEVLRVFLDQREKATGTIRSIKLDPETRAEFLDMIRGLEGGSAPVDLTNVAAFSGDETLEALIAAIRRDIEANAPQAALDRLHTYCMKLFAELLRREGERFADGDPLHARAGRFMNKLRREGRMSEYSEKIAKSSVTLMEQFNHIRNDRSLAHDNVVLSVVEGRYVFEAVTSLLAFVHALDGPGGVG